MQIHEVIFDLVNGGKESLYFTAMVLINTMLMIQIISAILCCMPKYCNSSNNEPPIIHADAIEKIKNN